MIDLANKYCGPQAANVRRARVPLGTVWERSRVRVCVIDTHTHHGRLCPVWSISNWRLRGASGPRRVGQWS